MKFADKENEILAFWKKQNTFQKSLEKNKKGKHFVFYEGPPTANGKPGIHHVLARAFKDIVLRYKTMQGCYVPRRAGWDTHGLPVELEIEKELGINSKQEIERYGIEKFIAKAKESVWRYKTQWEELTERMGFWIDTNNPYITYETSYIESLWHIIAEFHKEGLLEENFKVVPWCYRCGTPLSSHELAQGYKKVKDTAVYIKFKVESGQAIGPFKADENSYILSWTTTPWTLPGNVALAVGEDIEYAIVKNFTHRNQNGKAEYENLIIAKEIFDDLYSRSVKDVLKIAFNLVYADNKAESEDAVRAGDVVATIRGKDLVGARYKQLFDASQLRNEKSHKIYAADFVNTDEGTGVVHTSVMYGEDDFQLGQEVGLPKFHTVTEEGKFITSLGEGLAGLPVKAKETEEKIISYLKEKNLLLAHEQYEHDYPFCWRCKNPLLYYATKSWFVKTTARKKELIQNNKQINWVPAHLKDGRFGNFLEEVKDWAFSRRRYWGTPLPVWRCEGCEEVTIIGSLKELQEKAKGQNNAFFLARHAQAENNAKNIVSAKREGFDLTKKGLEQAKQVAQQLKEKNVDVVVASPLLRTKHTAQIIAKETGAELVLDERLREIEFGPYEGVNIEEYRNYWGSLKERFTKKPKKGMENFHDVRVRLLQAFWDINRRYKNKTIVLVTHQGCLWVIQGALRGLSDREIAKEVKDEFNNDEVRELKASNLPHDTEGEINLHRPFVDNVVLPCPSCKGEARRVEEVADVWFDSGAMPFAQAHWPFAFAQSQKSKVKSQNDNSKLNLAFPADYIVEAIDQTRGWFYTLLVTSTLLGKEAPYKNVISLGHLLDEKGQKMSKSLGNIINPFEAMEQYGVDAIRWYFFVVNPPGLYKRFDAKEILAHQRRFIITLINSANFLSMYGEKDEKKREEAKRGAKEQSIDTWMRARLQATVIETTKALEGYDITSAARLLEDLVDDMSNWYIRRSRDRFQGKEKALASAVLLETVETIAKLIAPFVPFVAEAIWQEHVLLFAKEGKEKSVHLATWPDAKQNKVDRKVLEDMAKARELIKQALAKRAEAGMRVRQPLAVLTIKEQFESDIRELIAKEVNVKSVLQNNSIKEECILDTTLTRELLEEGFIREVIRKVQDLRKRQGLTPKDSITLLIEGDKGIVGLLDSHEKELLQKVGAKALREEHIDKEASGELNFEDKQAKIGIRFSDA